MRPPDEQGASLALKLQPESRREVSRNHTYMRDEDQSLKAVRYIEQNPVKAGLVREASAWLWSSARLRDAYGRLGAPSFHSA